MSVTTALCEQFREQGYVEPVRVLSPEQCRQFLLSVRDAAGEPPLDWDRGRAATSRTFYEVARNPAVVDVVVELLGQDVMLWGASLQDRSPGDVHPWHSDIECSDPAAKIVSVWIGLENTSRDSSLLIIPYSHRFGLTVQQIRHQRCKRREETTSADIVAWAREQDERSHLVTPEMTDGEALFFDGKLWHGSNNLFPRTRRALLLQYATPDTKMRIPDFNYLDWPFHLLNVPRPGCLMLRGSTKAGVNRIISAPAAATDEASPRLSSQVRPLRIPLPPDNEEGWKFHPIFYGSTPDMRSFSCHASVLIQNHRAHPLHTHREEELKVLLAGEVDLILAEDRRVRLKAGQLVYYPPELAHTLETVSETPANYLTFKWHTDPADDGERLPFGIFDVGESAREMEGDDGFRLCLLFEGCTPYLRKLHGHFSTLMPGAGYEPHIDAYDAAIVVLEGEVETHGERVGPHAVILNTAGDAHGMRNPGTTAARYVVFEFHASQSVPEIPHSQPALTAVQRLSMKLKHLLGRFSRGMNVLGNRGR